MVRVEGILLGIELVLSCSQTQDMIQSKTNQTEMMNGMKGFMDQIAPCAKTISEAATTLRDCVLVAALLPLIRAITTYRHRHRGYSYKANAHIKCNNK